MVVLEKNLHGASPHEIYLILKRRIDDGTYAPGAWLPAERALATEFGVDRSSVRRAIAKLDEHGLIGRRPGARPWVGVTRSRQPADFARRPEPVGAIVAVMPQHPLYPASQAILHGINAALRSKKAAHPLRVVDTYGATRCIATAHEAEALDEIDSDDVSAVILWQSGGIETVPHLMRLQRQGAVIVLVDRQPVGFYCDFVGTDNRSGIDDAIAHLASLGHRRIGYVTTGEETTAVAQRLEAFGDVMRARFGRLRDDWVYTAGGDDFSAVGPAIEQFHASPEPPTAVVAMNDPLAYFMIAALEDRGLRVPSDMSVIGFDDLDRYSARRAILTTMRQQFEAIGRRAAELALTRLDADGGLALPSQHILLPAPLIERGTCAPLRNA